MLNLLRNFKFLILLLYSTVLLASPIQPSGGDVVNNHGGFSENNILFAWTNLSNYVESCLYSKGCGLSIPEQTLLEKIYKNHRYELQGSGIRFLSSQANPGYFTDETGTTRAAVTGNTVGSPIYFNVEALYHNVDGRTEAVDAMSAVGFLVHELGHHHGVTDHTYLDRLGGKVKTFISSQRLLTADFRKYRNNNFNVSVFSQALLHEVSLVPMIHVRAQVSVSNGYEVFDLSDFFKTPSRCDVDKNTFIESSATDLTIMPLPAFNSVNNTQTINFQVVVNWDCNPWPQPGVRRHFNQTLEVSNIYEIKELRQINLFDWELKDIHFNPPSWKNQDNVILHPDINNWQVKEVLCEKTDFNFNPLGPCDF